MQRVLVPLDGSAFAESALPFAITVARASTPCAIDLVGVYVSPPPSTRALSLGGAAIGREQAEQAAAGRADLEHYLSDVADRVRDAMPNATVTVHTRQGNASGEIAALAEETRAALTVLTTHGRGGWDRLWFGSVTLDVMRKTGQPVLAVRPAPVPREYLPLDGAPLHTALVAVDDLARADTSLRIMQALFGHTLEAATVLHVHPSAPQALGRVFTPEPREDIARRTARDAMRLRAQFKEAWGDPHRTA